MEASRKEFGHLKHFDLEEIKSITNDFDNNKVIGEGGFGKVYNGVLSDSDGQIMVAFKRLDRKYGQGDPEFLKEILMLSTYTHENLISLLGFCDEAGEKILVYEHASRGSLDRHLSSTTLTWTQRLKICLGAAKALCYLHDPKGTQERVIHRDIKSSNILLDDNWNAKVSDMGLSKVGPANQPQTFLATKVAGTPVYIDPDYMETNILTKESDVYSFGVVLFEVLCGRLCCEYNNNHFQSLVPKWKKNYKRQTLDDFIFHDLKKGMDRMSLKTFSNIAYQCLKKSHEYRPKMSYVVEKLELALRFQPPDSNIVAESEEKVKEFEEKVKTAVNKDELLSNGIIINGGNTWFTLNKNGERCEMISAECFYSSFPLGYSCNYFSRRDHDYVPYDGENKSRFEVRNRTDLDSSFDAHVRTQFLSPHITYKVNLVFKYLDKRADCLGVAYKLAGEKNYSTMLLAHERGDGWSIGELYEFVSDTKNLDLEFLFVCNNPIEVEGIEFVPVEKVQNELLLEDEDVEMQTETYWEQKLPSDYEDIIKWSVSTLQWTTKKQLYSIFCQGFLINDGEEWFSLAKNGKKCHMLSTTLALDIPEHRWDWEYLSESRFGVVAIDPVEYFRIDCRSSILSPQTTYAIYLVYKLQENHSWFELPIRCRNYVHYQYEWCIYLLSPQAPVIAGEFYNKKCLPQQRNDGWMEVRVYEFQTDTERISMDFPALLDDFNSLRGLIVQGIELKPI